MISKNSLVLYKKQPAIVQNFDEEKIYIKFQTSPATNTGKKANYAELKVRQKDIVILTQNACSSLENVINFNQENFNNQINETYELIQSDSSTMNKQISFTELCDFFTFDENKNSFNKNDSYWFVFKNLCNSLEFILNEEEFKNNQLFFIPRTNEQIKELKEKEFEKEHALENYQNFINRLKERKLNLPDDAKYMVEVENVALGQCEKSKVLVDLKIPQTPEKAHKLLIETKIWDITKNPYPARYGLSSKSATEGLGKPPIEERLEIKETAYAIDNEWSNDPDDAVNFDGKYLWVHIADPASFVQPDSSIDKVARNKGTTLYLPEGTVRMLAEQSLADYALGLQEKSLALSFRILLDEDNSISECKIFKTIVNVKRLTYKQATEQKDLPELKPLFDIAQKNIERRKKSGATNITMPEIHISVDEKTKKVEINPLIRYQADSMICEMMLLAGEGAAHFAFNNNIPFPYVSQEAPNIPSNIPEGLAGQFALLKTMRKRSVGITPAMHSGLGIAIYSQVTSPLRRYSDLIAHQQLRAFLDKKKLIDKDKMLLRISQGDAACVAAKKASRYTETHWKLIYLLQNPEWTGQATCIENKGEDSIMMIESLAMQTTIKNQKFELNSKVTIKPTKIDITTQEVVFAVL